MLVACTLKTHFYVTVSALSSKYQYFCQQMATVVNSQKKNGNFFHLL